MKVSFGGYGEKLATFEAETGVAAGMPVQVSANGTVSPCGSGKAFCGVAVNARGGLAAVQLSGYAQLPYAGTAPAVGYAALSGDGTGKIKTDAAGRSLLVVDVDTAAGLCGVIL